MENTKVEVLGPSAGPLPIYLSVQVTLLCEIPATLQPVPHFPTLGALLSSLLSVSSFVVN